MKILKKMLSSTTHTNKINERSRARHDSCHKKKGWIKTTMLKAKKRKDWFFNWVGG
jgi:hypothetical protein